MPTSEWEVELSPQVEQWFVDLPADEQDAVASAIDYLEQEGPTAGRPVVDRVHRSDFHNMKELRAKIGAKHFRILFIFDANQTAQLLVGGDKAGAWNQWYKQNVPIADAAYRQFMADEEEGSSP